MEVHGRFVAAVWEWARRVCRARVMILMSRCCMSNLLPGRFTSGVMCHAQRRLKNRVLVLWLVTYAGMNRLRRV